MTNELILVVEDEEDIQELLSIRCNGPASGSTSPTAARKP